MTGIDTARRYAEQVVDDVFDGDPSRVRADLVGDVASGFYDDHGRAPDREEFVDRLVARYKDLTAADEEGYTPSQRADAHEKIHAARRQGKICGRCLGLLSYGGWIGSGAEVRESGVPLMDIDVTVRPNEIPRRFRGGVHWTKQHTVEVAYDCPAGRHDTGFSEYHFLTDGEFEAFRDDAVSGAEELADRLDLDD